MISGRTIECAHSHMHIRYSQMRSCRGILVLYLSVAGTVPCRMALFRSTWKGMSTPAQSANLQMPAPFGDYAMGPAYDEMFRANGRPRSHYRNLFTQLLNLPSEELYRFKKEADLSFFNQGITFTVYGRAEGTEQIFPHDLLPRIITSSEWAIIERGLTQRITFTVYGTTEGTEQIFPPALLPRIITSSEWAIIERGLTQRITFTVYGRAEGTEQIFPHDLLPRIITS